jgi:ribosome biogenesis GTPase YqeH
MVSDSFDSKQLTEERCAGCGVALQTEDEARLGFIPSQALTRQPLICQRCFRIKNYNELANIALNDSDFTQILGQIASKQALVVNLLDLFDFEGSIISGLRRFVGQNPILVAVNKIDLLPKNVNRNRILNWVRKQLKEHGLKAEDVVLCSAKKNIDFERLLDKIVKLRGRRDVYIVGATNVGKSTFINRLIKDHSDLQAELTTSQYPGTTLHMVHIPLDDGQAIVDTPGIVNHERMTEIIAKPELRQIMPEQTIKPLVFQLDEQQTLFFGGLARFDFVKGGHQSFTCYFANGLKIHRTKLERADELYAQHKGQMLVPPSGEHLPMLPKWTRHSLRVPSGAEVDIAISGLGWIRVNSNQGALIDVHAPKGIRVIMRDAMI